MYMRCLSPPNSPSVYSERSLQRVASMASRAERGECSALHDGVVGASERWGSYKRSAQENNYTIYTPHFVWKRSSLAEGKGNSLLRRLWGAKVNGAKARSSGGDKPNGAKAHSSGNLKFPSSQPMLIPHRCRKQR